MKRLRLFISSIVLLGALATVAVPAFNSASAQESVEVDIGVGAPVCECYNLVKKYYGVVKKNECVLSACT